MGGVPTVIGPRVTLRPWELGDAEWVFEACQDGEIQRWTRVPSPYTRADAVAFLAANSASDAASGAAAFAVVEAGSGDRIGSIAVHEVRDGVADIGYWTAAPARGHGLTAAAVHTLVAWLAANRLATRAEALIEPENAASRAMITSAGFIETRLLPGHLVVKGRTADALLYSLVLDLANRQLSP